MKKLIKIDNIMFRVKDLDTAATFYTQALGLKQVWRDDKHQMA
jgi:catechol 2,3-dioxygenase-like lactoylglutathione lyase family enzyme